jgi:hypothetical protein
MNVLSVRLNLGLLPADPYSCLGAKHPARRAGEGVAADAPSPPAGGVGGSGGRGFVFLEKQHGKWKVITRFTGGFILNNRWTPSTYNPKYLTMTVWSRTGAAETWQDLYAYKNNKYKVVNSQQVPLTVLYSKDFQEMLLVDLIKPSKFMIGQLF